MYDVAVIGGGPAGSRVAYHLAGLGYEVVVLERGKRLDEPVCCTGIISQECAAAFAVDERVIARWVNSARLFSPSRRWLHLWRPEPQACIVDRSAFNLAFAERAQGKGARYILDSPVRTIKVGSDRVTVETGQQEACFEARVAVLATGAGSGLVAESGLGRVGDATVGAQVEVTATGVDEVEVYLGGEVAPGFFAWLVPTSPQRALVGLMSRHNAAVYLERLVSFLRAQGKITAAASEPRYGRIPLRPLARTYGDRLIVVGAAAGQVKPTTGGGIYYGLLCADLAADNLHRALAGDDLSARNLAKYQREWQKKLGWELKVGYWARRFYERLSDARVDRIFAIIESRGIVKADDLSFDWHGGIVLRLMGHQALSRVRGAVKFPFYRKRQPEKSQMM